MLIESASTKEASRRFNDFLSAVKDPSFVVPPRYKDGKLVPFPLVYCRTKSGHIWEKARLSEITKVAVELAPANPGVKVVIPKKALVEFKFIVHQKWRF